MKTFIILTVCLVAVSANSYLKIKEGSSQVKDITKQCLIDYKINPAVIQLEDEKNLNLFAELSEEKQGCVVACVYKGFNWLKDDGSLDIMTLTEGDTEEERTEFVKNHKDCSNQYGKNYCKIFECLDKKYDD